MNKVHKKNKQSAIIGWREILILPELNITCIKAKIDTGARTSALHALDYQEFEHQGQRMIRFETHPLQRDNKQVNIAEAELLEYRQVNNSGGQAQVRPIILTTYNQARNI